MRLVLFDLGGVLIHYDPIGPLMKLIPHAADREAVTRRWSNCDALRRLETGQCLPGEFAAAAVAEFNLRVTPEKFIENFALWLRGPMLGAVGLLRSLRKTYRLACLSNSNPVHWDRMRAMFGLDREFDATYVSHAIGIMKPDRRVYKHVLTAENVQAENVLFIDDNAENVAGARAVRISAFQCAGIDAVRAQLGKSLGDVLAFSDQNRPT